MDSVSEAEEFSARLAEIPDDIDDEWPEAIRFSLAAGHAVRVEVPVNQRVIKRSHEAAKRLTQEPTFQAEARRIFHLVGEVRPFPSGEGREAIKAWSDADEQRMAIIRREASAFAAAHRFAYISPSGVVGILFRLLVTLSRDQDGKLPSELRIRSLHDAPVIYVNPLADGELSAPIEPGHILVDLTNATGEDLAALAPILADVQRRLGYLRRSGGRPHGGTNWSREEFLEGLPRATREFEDRHLRKPTDTEVAAEMGISPATFGRYKKRFLPDSE